MGCLEGIFCPLHVQKRTYQMTPNQFCSLHQVTDPSWVSIMLGSNILTASYLPLISITSKNTTSSPRKKPWVNFEEWLPPIHVNQGGSSWKILFSGGKKKHEQSPWGSGTSFFLTDVEPAEPLGPKSGSNVMSFIILQSISQLRSIKWKSIIPIRIFIDRDME